MKRPSMIAAGTGFLLALLAAGYLLLAPCVYRGVAMTSQFPGDGVTRHSTCSSLIEVNGLAVIGWVVLPVVLTGIAFVVAGLHMRVALWVCSLISLAFSLLTGFSIGFVFIPSTLALVTAAILGVARPQDNISSR